MISNARRGRFRETLPDLLELARLPDAGEDAWGAAAAAVEILFWHEEFTAAADLTIELIERQDSAEATLWDQDDPFDIALLADGLSAAGDPAARLAQAAERAPEGSILRRRMAWLAQQLPERGLEALLPSYYAWNSEPKPLESVIGGALVERPFASLTPRERALVWAALRDANDGARARRLFAEHDEVPETYPESFWFAGVLVLAGDPRMAERVLRSAHDLWYPYKYWDAIPIDIVLQPVLRPAMTEQLREYYLTQPIGPERSTKA